MKTTEQKLREFRREMAKLQKDMVAHPDIEVRHYGHAIQDAVLETLEHPPAARMIIPHHFDGEFKEAVYEFKEWL